MITKYSNPIDLNGKSILITGGSGSFGKHFIKSVLDRYAPKRLIVFSRDELKQYEMAKQLGQIDQKVLRFFIGDVRDYARLEMAMQDVDFVVHAAALKQVPTAEYNPFECIQTNIHGAENVVRAAINNNIDRVIALSTDKAANPINLYGASKLASDKIFVAANSLSSHRRTRFAVVRYGNVIGSRGSVVPFFRQCVAEGSTHLTITDPEMTRFVIALGSGVNFVLSCFNRMKGGEIFVPKLPSVNIVDLAKAIAPELPHEVVGIRPGEKLHEVMVTADDARNTLELTDSYMITPQFKYWDDEPYTEQQVTPVPDRFTYSSDSNNEWLDREQIQQLLRNSEAL